MQSAIWNARTRRVEMNNRRFAGIRGRPKGLIFYIKS
nr:MAG TPA: hypothetical protein [Bacteriophage sp.]